MYKGATSKNKLFKSPEETYHNVVQEYIKRDYKIPGLHSEIFKNTPLLNHDQQKIKDYYTSQMINSKNAIGNVKNDEKADVHNKYLVFTEKLNS